jgi:hypothetical protein
MQERTCVQAVGPNAPLAQCHTSVTISQTPDFHIPAAMQSLPDARSQSFEELYGPPENFLEIEVRINPAFT